MSALIEAAEELRALCQRLADADRVALDTEFMRTDTYYARLCLIQLAVADEVRCVDALALDLSPLLSALARPGLLKILHAGRQDLEVLADLGGEPLAPVFDTQIAAALAGFDDQIGYAALVEQISEQHLPKLHTRTDWSRRPLTGEQLSYAEDDVRFLPRLHSEFAARLEALGRRDWMLEECRGLIETVRRREHPDEAFRRLRGAERLSARERAILRELAAWREGVARRSNRPRAWITPDRSLFALARAAPRDPAALGRVLAETPKLARRFGEELLDAIARGVESGAGGEPATRQAGLSGGEKARLGALLERIDALAARLQLRPAVLARRRELEAVARGAAPQTVFDGWRARVLAPALGDFPSATRAAGDDETP